MTASFLRALALGFSVAAPVGPIGILCIRRTLSDGRAVGFACGLGAATADALYGLAAGLGMAAFSSALAAVDTPARLAGGLFLGVLGVRTFATAPPAEGAAPSGRGRLGAWASTFLLTITNPATVLSFAAMFAAIAPVSEGQGWLRAPLLAGGVFLGSAAWWLLLSGAADRLRSRLSARHLGWVNRGAGLVLVAFAAWALASLVSG